MTADLLFGAQRRDEQSLVAERSLAALTDSGTFSRALRYVEDGAVLEIVELKGEIRLKGRVRGSRNNIYTCAVMVNQARSGAITSLGGACTCPVVTNCKHVFALAITAFRVAPMRDPLLPDAGRAAVPAWKRSLSLLLRDERAAPVEADVVPLGLQVELIAVGRPVAIRGAGRVKPAVQVGLRPVMQGARGGWIRTGISWDRLGGAHGQQRRQPRADHLELLREIQAVDAASSAARYYGYGETFIYLDVLNSRHIWDLLARTREIGLPIVQSGRDQRPVTVSDGAAEVSLDLRRMDGQLVMTPTVAVDGAPVGEVDFALLGTPLHGLALWPTSPGQDHPGIGSGEINNNGLTLVRSHQRLAPELRNLLAEGDVCIPSHDEASFLADFLPRLARRAPLSSRDGTLDIPRVHPPRLALTVTGLPGHRASLQWEWRYRIGEVTDSVSLWPAASEPPVARSPAVPRVPGRGAADAVVRDTVVTDSVIRDAVAEQAALSALRLPEADLARLTGPSPTGPRLLPELELAGVDAADFFCHALPQLRELPDLELDVVNELTFRLAVNEPVISITNTQNANDRDWFDLGITITVDGEQVPFNGLFLALAAGEQSMILPSGTYFSVDREPFLTLRRLIDEARALDDVPGRTIGISRYQAALWQEFEDLAVVTAQADAWRASVGGLLEAGQDVDRPVPATLLATLRPYQRLGFQWLAFLFEHDLGGVLADDMGLGKTVQTLALICHAKAGCADRDPFLVVAPTSVIGNWAAECARFAPHLRVVTIGETLSRSGAELTSVAANADVVITSYALFRLDFERYSQQSWSGLILDEAQFVKNHQSKAYQCAKTLRTPFKLAITGTPMENNLLELWSIFSITAPGLFAQSGRFREYYQAPIEKDGDSDRLRQLRQRIRPLMLRRKKEHVVADLPAKQEQVIELELNPRHRKVYQRHLQRERQKVLGLINDMQKNRFVIFRSLTLLRQLSLDASLVDPAYATIPSTKLDALMDRISDLVADGHRTLVFSQFTGFLDRVRQRMDDAGIDYCYLDGATRRRPEVLAEFKNGSAPVFLISLKAGGVGLNLTEADYCILLDPWWNPATEAQAVDRIHRIGQTRNVMVYRFVAKDTIEEKVMALKATKAKLFDSVMETGTAQSAALTANDVRELLS